MTQNILKAIFLIYSMTLVSIATAQVKVACIGASITYGATIHDREKNSYPAQLQAMLGSGYNVINCGVSGTTMLYNGDYPYIITNEYKAALKALPDVVIIDLGGNDSKLINRLKLANFQADCSKLIASFAKLPSHPRIVLLTAMPSFVSDTTAIWDPVIVHQVNPRIQNAAFVNNVEIIDMHSPMVDKEAIMPDKIHPNKEGATIMAGKVYDNIMQRKNNDYDVFKGLPQKKKISSFYGYQYAEFVYKGRECIVVKPKWSAKGAPWVWRARFWGHEPQLDISLLERGFHIVYCDVAELFGNNTAINAWNNFHTLLVQSGLGKKAVLEGMSRGGIYAFNWAAVNPDKVACVYVDNPVLDLKSWPAGKGRVPLSPAEFEQFKQAFNLTDSASVNNFAGSPINKITEIVKGKYPILIVCADADEAVPIEENSNLFARLIKSQNGNIKVIYKHGFKHHPHSLPNPKPITDFILQSVSL
jgi:lysophospholipase L1-like esterase